jgi:type I restriction enzyme R subunit
MGTVGQREIQTQKAVVRFFQEALGYVYLGHWQDRAGNSNIEEELLAAWLKRQGYGDKIVQKVLRELDKAAALTGSKTLYDANREVYGLLRYGVKVRPDVGEQHVTVWLIDWAHPEDNDFAIAEEVTVYGVHTKRPDIVLYVNGIALCVLELKRSTVSVTEGIRQNLDSQKKEFIRPFYATVQLAMAGNDTEGLRYGVIETPEKYWLRWKEAEAHPAAGDNPLLWELSQLCGQSRLLELVHDFIVFDAGIKKTCRHNQYFGVKAAQQRVRRREGGILWHTQGSGKSLTMVWLAKWIREHVRDARVLIVTDRTELDEQIEKVFKGVSEAIYRTRSGADLVQVLNASEEWLVCSLVHKFGGGEELSDKDIDAYVEEIKRSLGRDYLRGFHARGDIFVFVDECHRTQSGKLHDAMKALLPGAMLIGFTGTPLLKSDKRRSIETFGPYIHTYKYDEAVRDGVVLDLRYEARDIDQNITSQAKIDQWFELKTRGLTDVAKAQLKQRWGTMQQVLSTRDRLEKIVADILLDMEMKLLIVVDKLLTGFDVPPATYLYIDKPMQDHGLFQAICRVNRLDGEDKEYGYIIDYKDLFRSLEQSIKDYTGEAFAAYDKADVEGLLKDRLSQGRERLEEVREAIKALCEPVAPPRDTAAYLLDERMQLQVKVADTAADVAELTTLAVDDAIRRVKKADWRGNRFKEREVRNAIKAVLRDDALVDSILAIVMNRNS